MSNSDELPMGERIARAIEVRASAEEMEAETHGWSDEEPIRHRKVEAFREAAQIARQVGWVEVSKPEGLTWEAYNQ